MEYQDEDTSQGRPDRDYVPVSGSIGARRTIGKDYVATLSVGHYERAPATEELYSFGPHEATATFERGEADFDTEKSNSVELGFRKIHGRTRFDGALYATRFNDFIYLDSVDRGLNADGSGAFDADGQADFVDEEGAFTPGGEFQLVDYVAGDATFYGGEAELSYDLLTGPRRLTAAVQGDYVRAELDNDTNLPRITPGRYGASLTYDDARWRATFQTLQTTQTGHAAPLEPVSQSFTDMNAFVGFKIPTFDTTRALVYLRGDNLLDERIVRQNSFLRVPQPGRVVSTGIDVRF